MTDTITVTLRVDATDAIWAAIARPYFAALIELRRAIDQGDGPAAARAARTLEHQSDAGAAAIPDSALDRAAAAAKAEFTRMWGPEVPADLWHRVAREVLIASPGYQEPIIKAVERILDECSAWITRPNAEVTERIALAAGIAVMSAQSERHDQVYVAGFAAGQEEHRRRRFDDVMVFCKAIRSLSIAPAPSPWRPISEAPKDGTTVLLAVTGGRGSDNVVTAYWNKADGNWWLTNTDIDDYTVSCIADMMTGQITHYMPLPAAPVAEA